MNNSSNANANNNGGGDSGNGVNYAALVIAVVAFLASALQVLQQYLASAGYSSVTEQVMGGWHATKRRHFRPKEFRFEVLFDSPVIFVSPYGNTKGPIKNTPILFLDGHPEPDVAALTILPTDDALRPEHDPSSSLSTASDERATWLTLLNELQAMELGSEEWQAAQHPLGPPYTYGVSPAPFSAHSLCVAIQRKKRSWDMMPRNLTKPYATTTMCHIIEIAAMMGIHWLEFDRIKNNFLAFGNGLSLTGRLVQDLGPTFSFHTSLKSRWEQNRCIPVDAVKDLCFGFLPTIFRPDGANNLRRVDPSDENSDLGLLQLGSADHVAEAMMLLGCNTDTSNFFRSANGQHTHLFPLAFELVGMIGQVLHIKDTCFRMLPNPTPYHWDKKFFSLRRLTIEFRDRIKDAKSYHLYPEAPQMVCLLSLAERVARALSTSREVDGNAGASIDTYDRAAEFSFPLLRTLHESIDQCDAYLHEDDVPEDLVVMVVREHLQHVMAMLNAPEQFESDASSDGGASRRSGYSGGGSPAGDGGGANVFLSVSPASEHGRTRHFTELSAASPELRQKKFMDLYFSVVLGHVRERAVRAFHRRKATYNSMLLPAYRSREGSISPGDDDRFGLTGDGQSRPSMAGTLTQQSRPPSSGPDAGTVMDTPRWNREEGEPAASPPRPVAPEPGEQKAVSPETLRNERKQVPELRVTRAAAAALEASSRSAGAPADKKVELDKLASTIWCTLQFRMLLWLMLHDFHKRDVQISKSELYGSRLPVYIS